MYAGTACTTLTLTTDVNDVTRSYYEGTIYCPMPFQPDSYTVCCLNVADEMRCCQKDVVPVTHNELSYVSISFFVLFCRHRRRRKLERDGVDFGRVRSRDGSVYQTSFDQIYSVLSNI